MTGAQAPPLQGIWAVQIRDRPYFWSVTISPAPATLDKRPIPPVGANHVLSRGGHPCAASVIGASSGSEPGIPGLAARTERDEDAKPRQITVETRTVARNATYDPREHEWTWPPFDCDIGQPNPKQIQAALDAVLDGQAREAERRAYRRLMDLSLPDGYGPDRPASHYDYVAGLISEDV